MLDLTKIEAGAMPIKMIRADINLYIRYIVELFRSVAATARIALNYTFVENQLVIDYDPYKLMQIITNLLSNALKFTQPGGRVEVCSSLTGDGRFEIRVSDDGPGIPEDYLPQIFDRFSRGEMNYTYTTPGSGLGLSLTKELVKLLNGTITVESVFGEGTEFIITLPLTYNAPLQEGSGPHDFDNNILRYIFHPDSREAEVKAIRHKHDEKPVLLVVEDNDDVAQYLMTLLAKDYDVIIAVNGEDGVTKSIEYMPDIIISDIMMPVMDGIEMLKSVKNDFRTSHIPVVILTARADIGSRLEGLERGADAYIAKPFVKEELLVQIRSLIQLRKNLQERYASATHLHLTEDIDFHIEDAFMQRIRDISMVNLSDESFHIDSLCREMAMSRTQLYRKFRSLTDKTIAEYFRSLRLHKAKELLSNSELSVSEAAYKTGFKNVSHFSRVFTQEFGINPREIRK
jgi:DNA-binding response OmpR family regulator